MEKKIFRWLIDKVKKYSIHFILLIGLNSLISLCAVYFAFQMRKVIDFATLQNRNQFILYLSLITGILLFQLMIYAITKREEEYVRGKLENEIKLELYQDFINSDYGDLSSYHTGELLNYLVSDVTIVSDGVVSIVPNLIAMAVRLFGALYVMYRLDKILALIFFSGGIFFCLFTLVYKKIMKNLHKNVQSQDGKLRSFLQESLSNLLIIKAYKQEENNLKQAKDKMNLHFKARMKRNRYAILNNVGFSLVMDAGYLFGLLWCGVGILDGRITYGVLTSVLQLINQIQQPFTQISTYLSKYYALLASSERILEVASIKKEERKIPKVTDFDQIRLEDVEFYYEKENKILEHCSLEIAKGDTIAIIGTSGHGKSTLLKLLLDLYHPTQGNVYFIKGDEKINLSSFSRSLFAYVPQGNYLLSGTIRESLTFNQEKWNEEKLKEACKIACIDEVIEQLPHQYESYIGESGKGLSEGQIQRLAIARAIYFDAPILLLDECTSALDEQTEQKLIHNIKTKTNKTILLVTHKQSTLALCRHVYELKEHRLVEKM